jgi:hypothetical protein
MATPLDHNIFIYQSELEYLSRCILDYPDIETGGGVFGVRNADGDPIVTYVTGPGPQALHEVTHFRQDPEFIDLNAGVLYARHAIETIGSWHSHHQLGLDQPSGGDIHSTIEGLRQCGLSSVLLFIGNLRHGGSSVRPFRIHADGRMEELTWAVLMGESPVRHAYDQLYPHLVYQPRSEPNMAHDTETTTSYNVKHLTNNTDKIMMTQERLKDEYYALSQAFSPKQFRLTENDLTIGLQSNSGRLYTIKAEWENYPYDVPVVYVTSPKPLKDYCGEPLLEASHPMHTLPAVNGCTRICHYGASQWHPGVFLYQVVVKVRVWIEVYENHLKTGKPLDRYLSTAIDG